MYVIVQDKDGLTILQTIKMLTSKASQTLIIDFSKHEFSI